MFGYYGNLNHYFLNKFDVDNIWYSSMSHDGLFLIVTIHDRWILCDFPVAASPSLLSQYSYRWPCCLLHTVYLGSATHMKHI